MRYFLLGVGVGIGVGYATGLLTAPMCGKDARKALKKQANKGMKIAKSKANDGMDYMMSAGSDAAEYMKSMGSDLGSKATEMLGKGRKAAASVVADSMGRAQKLAKEYAYH